MADEVRQYIRAAQEAELRGDIASAIDCLQKAATLYKNSGSGSRALKLLRYAARLDGSRTDLRDEVNRLEWIPEDPLSKAVNGEPDEEENRALASLDSLATPQGKGLVDRGPTLADPELQAWCSFCCRPRGEVGNLVAGASGTFICKACAIEGSMLLVGTSADGAIPASSTLPPASEAGEAKASHANGAAKGTALNGAAELLAGVDEAAESGPTGALRGPTFVGQAEAVRILDAGMRMGARRILLVGPEGSGKTTYLKELEARGLGVYAASGQVPAGLASGERLLLDAVDQLEPVGLARVGRLLAAEPERPVIIALRGALQRPALSVADDQAELPVYSTRELLDATGGKLPLELAEQIQVVAAFAVLPPEQLQEIARFLLSARASELFLSDELLAALVAQAAASPRGAHELRALIGRIPPGSWNLKTATRTATPTSATVPAQAAEGAPTAPAKKRRSRKKTTE